MTSAAQALATLRATRSRLSHPRSWTKGAMARNQHGAPVPADCGTAYAWDLTTALKLESIRHGAFIKSYHLIQAVVGDKTTVAYWNDTTNHAELLAKLDSAIDLAVRQLPAEKEAQDDLPV
jgi:hypothetical protein